MPEVVNIVASGTLGREVDIRAVGEDISAVEVKSQTDEYKTPAAYIRKQKDSPLITVYESGSYHISGAKSVDGAVKTKDWFVGELKRIGVKDIKATFAVKNVVVVGDLEETVDLNRLAVQFGLERVEYEPEQFPGMVYRPNEIESVFLIFASGRVVIPGSSSAESAFDAFDWLVEQVDVKKQA
jgi:transcription initiation factor TFIID TATA-box-binding protein